LVEKHHGRLPLGRLEMRWDNIKIGLGKIGCDDMRWMEIAQDRVQTRTLVIGVLNLRILLPWN